MLHFNLPLIASLPAPSMQLDQLSAEPQQTIAWIADNLDGTVLWMEFKPWSVYGCVEIGGDNHFIKIHEAGRGYKELEQSINLENYLPTIVAEKVVALPPFECLVQPYLKSIESPGGLFFDTYYLFPEQVEPLLIKMIDLMKKVVFSTLDLKIAPAINDRLFFDRLKSVSLDGSSGRIEKYYADKTLLDHPWEEIIQKKFTINGVAYNTTIGELIQKSRKALNPSKHRPLAICHGDWIDMNVCIIDGSPYFLDCDLSGENDPIGDAMVFLIYCAIQGDYLGPKYFPSHFPNRQKLLQTIDFKRPKLQVNVEKNVINIQDPAKFGTSTERKNAATLFVEEYFNPLIEVIESKGYKKEEIEEKIQGGLLARLLLVYNLTSLEIQDQARIISLLIQSLCQKGKPTLTAFLESL